MKQQNSSARLTFLAIQSAPMTSPSCLGPCQHLTTEGEPAQSLMSYEMGRGTIRAAALNATKPLIVLGSEVKAAISFSHCAGGLFHFGTKVPSALSLSVCPSSLESVYV